jgi:hypothetical protein
VIGGIASYKYHTHIVSNPCEFFYMLSAAVIERTFSYKRYIHLSGVSFLMFLQAMSSKEPLLTNITFIWFLPGVSSYIVSCELIGWIFSYKYHIYMASRLYEFSYVPSDGVIGKTSSYKYNTNVACPRCESSYVLSCYVIGWSSSYKHYINMASHRGELPYVCTDLSCTWTAVYNPRKYASIPLCASACEIPSQKPSCNVSRSPVLYTCRHQLLAHPARKQKMYVY